MKFKIPLAADGLHKLTANEGATANIMILQDPIEYDYYICVAQYTTMVLIKINEVEDFIPDVLIDTKTWQEIIGATKAYTKSIDAEIEIIRFKEPPLNELDVPLQKLQIELKIVGASVTWVINERQDKVPPVFDILHKEKSVRTTARIESLRMPRIFEYISKQNSMDWTLYEQFLQMRNDEMIIICGILRPENKPGEQHDN